MFGQTREPAGFKAAQYSVTTRRAPPLHDRPSPVQAPGLAALLSIRGREGPPALELSGRTGANCQHAPPPQQDMEIRMSLRYPFPPMKLCPEYEQGLSCLGFGDLRERVMAGYGERVFAYGDKRLDMKINSIYRHVG